VADVLFVVITIAFFVVCVGYVHLCDRIIGPDPNPEAGGERPFETDTEAVKA
jgi:hypothetical protein